MEILTATVRKRSETHRDAHPDHQVWHSDYIELAVMLEGRPQRALLSTNSGYYQRSSDTAWTLTVIGEVPADVDADAEPAGAVSS